MDAFTLAALAAMSWGTSSFFEKIGVRHGDPLAGVLARTAGVVLGSVLFAVLVPSTLANLTRMSRTSFACFAAGGILASVVGQILFYQALQKSDIGRVAAVGGAWPAVAFLLGVLFLGEPFSWRKTAGVSLVMAGVALLR